MWTPCEYYPVATAPGTDLIAALVILSQKNKKPLHLNKKDGTVIWHPSGAAPLGTPPMAVSPFDGVNRIRFKGSHAK